jgi:hypothetical protein
MIPGKICITTPRTNVPNPKVQGYPQEPLTYSLEFNWQPDMELLLPKVMKTRHFRTSFLVFLLILSLAGLLLIDSVQAGAQASTYYVATKESEQNVDGSITNPWATIGNAVAHVSDGATILVRLGTYTGRVSQRGSFANGIVIRSEVPSPRDLYKSVKDISDDR